MASKSAVAEKPNVGERLKGFFRGVLAELKRVHWPDLRQISVYTAVVIVAVLVMGVALWIIDSGFSYLLGLLLKGA
ncbi:MAG: preprotein translocase subunit SecE [Clostridiales bacterium]|jgi:preprotein translocase subunit SecE|nr:preprotein translocase subunit SecE [Clostridiales bacterium]MDR2712627.1 preprotein translocase subunit SecE [Clostridiales bacterium]